MKKKDIVLNGVYSNGREGRFYSERKVIAEGPQYVLYAGQAEIDCIRYEVVTGSGKGSRGHMTRARFATWAKKRIG